VTTTESVVDAIDALLPQTQCTKCGYAGCRPYAEAIATGAADINRCAPGGAEALEALAALTGRAAGALDPDCGAWRPRHVAVVDEEHCIGCTLCIQACPVDAIVGAAKQMHTVIAELCTGCDLCVPACPVDCIAMVPATGAHAIWDAPRRAAARARFDARRRRLERERNEVRGPAPASEPGAARPRSVAPMPDRQAVIRAAVQRVRARRGAQSR